VKEELYEKLEKEVRRRCEAFVKKGEDRGAGVKERMLEMLAQLADGVVDAASPAARKLLMKRYSEVEGEIRATFDKYRNPVDVALQELIGAPPSTEQMKNLEKQRALERRTRELLVTLPVVAAADKSSVRP
jgi:hypothetical protein